jgi:hypothetical protein
MATNFPTGVDTFTNPVSNDSLNSPSHSVQHADANDAIEAIENAIIDPANYPDQLVNKTTATVRPLPFAMATGAASVTGNATFTYPSGRFTESPILSLTILSASGASGTSATYGNPTASGFTAYVWSGSTASTSSRTVVYTAVQMTSANSSG